MSATPTISDILNNVFNAIVTVIQGVASNISSLATVIAQALVLGAVTFALVRYGSRLFRGITGWLGGLF